MPKANTGSSNPIKISVFIFTLFHVLSIGTQIQRDVGKPLRVNSWYQSATHTRIR